MILSSHKALLLTAAILSGCSSTPRSGPDFKAVEKGAVAQVSYPASAASSVGFGYALVDINEHVLSYLSQTYIASFAGGFGGGRGGVPSLPLGPGDVLQIAIFESQAGGLFIPAEAGSRPGNFVTLPDQTVGSSGNVTVPYAGAINVRGRSIAQVERDIEDKLKNRAIEPQVIVTKVKNRSSQVAVLGDVNSPTKIEISEAGERVLDVLSQAGGLSTPGVETYVTLQRRGRSATILYNHLINTPAENVFVAPGDTVIVNRERRTFLAFGASGLNGRFDFEDANLTLGEALGKAGGILDSRANPSQILLYRQADKSFLEKVGVDTSRFQGDRIPVIFRANVKDPSGFFALQKFPMQDKDIVYITNSDSVELVKFLTIVNSVSEAGASVSRPVTATQEAVRSF